MSTMIWPQQRVMRTQTETYRIGVAGITAQVTFWNGKAMSCSFYLRLAGASSASSRETLGERLNDPHTRFLACKVDERVELVSLKAISCIRVAGALPEVEMQEQLGAIRQPARVTLACGYSLNGDFLSILPSSRARLSDLLNLSDERFLLFLIPGATVYIQRDAIVRVVP
jgi:hypothetical protein